MKVAGRTESNLRQVICEVWFVEWRLPATSFPPKPIDAEIEVMLMPSELMFTHEEGCVSSMVMVEKP